MIRNIVFDIGNVLLSFDPEGWLSHRYPKDIAADLYKVVFLSGEWLDLDRGTISGLQATDRFVSRRPDMKTELIQVMNTWVEMMTPIRDSLKLAEDLKERGLCLYYLSNMAEQSAAYIRRELNVLQNFRGGVFSYEIHRIKPETDSYLELFRRCRLVPEECVFLDDRGENIEVAKTLGMEGILFNTAEQARDQLWKRFAVPV